MLWGEYFTDRVREQSDTIDESIQAPSSSGGDPLSQIDANIQKISDCLEGSSLEERLPDPEVQRKGRPGKKDQIRFGDEDTDWEEREPFEVDLRQDSSNSESEPASISDTPLYDDPSDEDDGDGEWITPSNVALHKSRALNLLPSASASRRGRGKQDEIVAAGCMTADFAMQNVLLQMGLSLIGVEGKRIQRVKTWVLRCHACFK